MNIPILCPNPVPSEYQMPYPIQHHHHRHNNPRKLQYRNFIPTLRHPTKSCSGALQRRRERRERFVLDPNVSANRLNPTTTQTKQKYESPRHPLLASQRV